MSDEPTICLLDLDSGVLHVAGRHHAVAECGDTMGDHFMAGRMDVLSERASEICQDCLWPWSTDG